MKPDMEKLQQQAKKQGIDATPSMLRRFAGKQRVTPRRAKHTRGRKPIEE